MGKEKLEKTSSEKLTEVEILKFNNVMLQIQNLNLQLGSSQQLRESLIAEVMRDHGFAPGAKINLDGVRSTITGERLSGPTGVVKDDKGSD